MTEETVPTSPQGAASYSRQEVCGLISPLLSSTGNPDELDNYVIVGVKNNSIMGICSALPHHEDVGRVLAGAVYMQCTEMHQKHGGTDRCSGNS